MAGIKHVEFWVSSLADSVHFYEKLFSLIGWDKVDANGFSDGAMKIYFIEQPFKVERSAGPRHICFLASSEEVVDELGAWLRGAGARIIRGPVSYEYKGKQAYTVDFRDPDGYVIEVATKSVRLARFASRD